MTLDALNRGKQWVLQRRICDRHDRLFLYFAQSTERKRLCRSETSIPSSSSHSYIRSMCYGLTPFRDKSYTHYNTRTCAWV